MTLPASGPLSLSDIQTEFGGSNPISLSEYYAGGGLVPAGTSGTYGAVPSSGALSIQNFYGTSQFIPVYIEDLFSTWLFNTSTPSNVTVTNGINLSGNGGLVWTKLRSTDASHQLYDTVRGGDNQLQSNTANGQTSSPPNAVQFGSNGFTWLRSGGWDTNTAVSWTFRKQPKFFDIQAFSTNYLGNTTISHNLGSTPGCILIKQYGGSQDWKVYHKSVGTDFLLQLNDVTSSTSSTGWITVSSTTIGFPGSALDGSSLYVAYIFADNAGGFGVTGNDNVISCGSYTGNASSTGPIVTLGYEPQWLMIKRATGSANGNWVMLDVMRGFSVSTDNELYANLNIAEGSGLDLAQPQATGFQIKSGSSGVNASGSTYIYIAIRRGPMKVPTVGTSVFTPATRTGTGAAATVTSAGFPIDLIFSGDRNTARGFGWDDRLSGAKQSLRSWNTAGYTSDTEGVTGFDSMTGMSLGNDSTFGGSFNVSGETYVYEMLRRAPSFFDVVRYTGTGVAGLTVTHNLTVVPEFMIVKGVSIAEEWNVYYGVNTTYLKLNSTDVAQTATTRWNDTSPTSSVFSLGTSNWVNQSGSTYVAYLFATCAGVSKVGTYTGTGALQTVNCGFSSGARFVLIKRINGTGDWYVWDSARGISSGNDPYLLLNTLGVEVTGTNYVDTTSVGFQVTAAAPAALNASGGTYIFLAIA